MFFICIPTKRAYGYFKYLVTNILSFVIFLPTRDRLYSFPVQYCLVSDICSGCSLGNINIGQVFSSQSSFLKMLLKLFDFLTLLHIFFFFIKLEGISCYAGLLLTPAEGFGLPPWLFLPFGQKRCFSRCLCLFRLFLVFSSNLSNC